MKLSEMKFMVNGNTFRVDENSAVTGYDANNNFLSYSAQELRLKETDEPTIDTKLQSRLLDIIEIQARK
tara:strand:+ start:6237 stop:6443 length:207 start_codon:yes stop_codon:yes gene_type:complete